MRGRDTVAENVRRLRLQKGWSQEHLADEAGITRNYVGHVERSEKAATVDVLDKLAAAFGVPSHTLLKPSDHSSAD